MTHKQKDFEKMVEQLRAIKKKTGMSFEAIAQRVGVSVFTIMRICNGTTSSPNQQTAAAIQRFIDEVLPFKQGK